MGKLRPRIPQEIARVRVQGKSSVCCYSQRRSPQPSCFVVKHLVSHYLLDSILLRHYNVNTRDNKLSDRAAGGTNRRGGAFSDQRTLIGAWCSARGAVCAWNL